jgi:hypothetical protein
MSRKAQRTGALRLPLVEVLKDLPWFKIKGHPELPYGKLPKFSSALRTPIIQSLSDQPVVDGVAHIDDAVNNIFLQRIEKLILLLKHYGIEDTNYPWLLLSLRLACTFVPGFRVLREPRRGRGRPTKWSGQAHDELIAEVNAVRSERKGRSISGSIKILKQREPKRYGSLTTARYYEALRDRKLRDETINALRTGRDPSTNK